MNVEFSIAVYYKCLQIMKILCHHNSSPSPKQCWIYSFAENERIKLANTWIPWVSLPGIALAQRCWWKMALKFPVQKRQCVFINTPWHVSCHTLQVFCCPLLLFFNLLPSASCRIDPLPADPAHFQSPTNTLFLQPFFLSFSHTHYRTHFLPTRHYHGPILL